MNVALQDVSDLFDRHFTRDHNREKTMGKTLQDIADDYDYKTDCRFPSKSRIDLIGQNGNTGEHYEEVRKEEENRFLSKLAEDHWNYIKGVLQETNSKTEYEIDEIGFHYKTAMKHGWKHAMEYKGEIE